MTRACRNATRQVERKSAAHAGLLLDRYLEEHGDKGEARSRLIKAASTAPGRARAVYELAFERYQNAISPCAARFLRVDGRLSIGLGAASPLEAGLRLHHTYGTPLLPGSALKGLANHYCASVWGKADGEFASGGRHHRVMFGTADESGFLVFHDAWISPVSLGGCLAPDVMAVHHPEYYAGLDAAKAPTDTDMPNPVSFLSVCGTFWVAVGCEDQTENGKRWMAMGMDLLLDALDKWGIGGKTNAGYGRLVPTD